MAPPKINSNLIPKIWNRQIFQPVAPKSVGNAFPVDTYVPGNLQSTQVPEVKVPYNGQVIKILDWKIFLGLKALANDPRVSQFEFVNELIERTTELFPEVKASYIRVNGNTLFSKKTYTEVDAEKMKELERSYGKQCEALRVRYQNSDLNKSQYLEALHNLNRAFEAKKLSVLGRNSFKFQYQIELGGRSFNVEMEFFASSPEGIPSKNLFGLYQKNIGYLLDRFLQNNIHLEEAFKDPLAAKGVHSRSWALFKLERLAEYYHKLGKSVTFGIFDADNFKGFNEGGNYRLGDDAISILNLSAEKAIRLQDSIELMRNGGDEIAILFVNTDPAGAKIAVNRANRVLRLATGVPLHEPLEVNHSLVRNMVKTENVSEKEAAHLVELANEVRAEILEKIKNGEFRHIKSVEQFNKTFCEPRLVSDVSEIGKPLKLKSGRITLTVAKNGELIVLTPQHKFAAKVNPDKDYKINVGGDNYVVRVDSKSDKVTVLHQVRGMQISGGIGATIDEATQAQMKSKDAGKGTVAVTVSKRKAPPEKKNAFENNSSVYEKFAVAESINEIWDKVGNESVNGSEEALKLYLEAYKKTFGDKVEVRVGGNGEGAISVIKVGEKFIEVRVAAAEPLLKEAVREFSDQIRLVEKTRQNLRVINQAALTEPLTGLPNRTVAETQTRKMLEANGEVKVYFFDMNDFKGFNKQLGYQGTDGLVKIVAEVYENAAKQFLKGEYVLSRLMGDEFLVGGPELSKEALSNANQVLEIVLGIDPNQRTPVTADAEGSVTLSNGKKIYNVSAEVLRAVNDIRPGVIKLVESGSVQGLTYKMLRKAILEPRQGRKGKVPGGARFSGGLVEVSMATLPEDLKSAPLETIIKRAVEQAGELADEAKKAGRKIIDKPVRPKSTNPPSETAPDQKVFDSAEKLNPTRTKRIGWKIWKANVPVAQEPIKFPLEVQAALKDVKKAFSDPRAAGKAIAYLKTPEGKALLKSEKGKEFLAKLSSIAGAQNGWQALKLEGGGLLVGLVTLIGVEKFVDLIGVENKQARFVLVLGLSHMSNLKTQDLLISTVLGKEAGEASKVLKSLQNSALFSKAMLQFKAVFGGLAEMSFVSVLYRGILDAAEVKPDSAFRSEAANLGTSFVGPTAAKFGYGRLAANFGESALTKTGLKFFGRIAGGVGLANLLTDGVYSLFASDYTMYVNRRAYVEVQTKRVGDGASGKVGAFISQMFHPIGGSALDAAAASDHPEVRAEVVSQDIANAQPARSELRTELTDYVKNGGNLSALSQKAEFGTLSIPSGEKKARYWKGEYIETEVHKNISEEKIFKYMMKYAQNHPEAAFGSEEHIAALIKHFDGLITAEHCQRIFEKGILISWQSRLAELHLIQPSLIDGFEAEILNDDIRAMFNKDGTLKEGKEQAFILRVKNNS